MCRTKKVFHVSFVDIKLLKLKFVLFRVMTHILFMYSIIVSSSYGQRNTVITAQLQTLIEQAALTGSCEIISTLAGCRDRKCACVNFVCVQGV